MTGYFRNNLPWSKDMTTITSKYKTIATVGYTGSVSRNENRAAHGAVCHLQARKTKDGRLVGRKVNTNGRHTETGEAFAIDSRQLAEWERIAKSSR
jgi:hypothetical protein